MQDQDCLEWLCLPSNLYRKIEEDVVRLFVEQNVTSYPIDSIALAASLGYELIPFSKMNKEAMNILNPKDADGINYYDPAKGKFQIYYRSDCIEERLRFTIGHEIGHIRMGHKCESDLARRIADYYAAYLLAPTPWIKQAGCEDYKDIAKKFYVSDQCASICFNRYINWCRLSSLTLKRHEKKLIDLLQ